MKKFELYIDEKVSAWRRTHVEVEADTLEEAVYKAAKYDYEPIESEILYGTEEFLDPTSEATVEIYDKTLNDLLYDNSK